MRLIKRGAGYNQNERHGGRPYRQLIWSHPKDGRYDAIGFAYARSLVTEIKAFVV